MNERMRFNPAELLGDSLAGIIGLAADNRLDECEARKVAFCGVVGPTLATTRGDRVKTIHAGRTGRVVKTYADASACICWDDGEAQIEGLGHERVPRHMLIDLASKAVLSDITDSEGGEL